MTSSEAENLNLTAFKHLENTFAIINHLLVGNSWKFLMLRGSSTITEKQTCRWYMKCSIKNIIPRIYSLRDFLNSFSSASSFTILIPPAIFPRNIDFRCYKRGLTRKELKGSQNIFWINYEKHTIKEKANYSPHTVSSRKYICL